MALRAAHIFVPSGQRKLRAFIVVKRGRRPPLVHMAILALGDPSVLGRELRPVRIRVASFALLRRPFELNLVRAGQHLVAFVAGHRAMRPDQRKFRLRMIEAANVDPGSSVVARFAALRRSIGPLGRHALLEFPLVDIFMAGRAGAVLEMERLNLVRSSVQAGFVALRAGHRHVRPGQHEVGLLVLGNGERRAMKILYRMAILATILVGRRRKLLVMRILVAIRARRELHFVERVLARRQVAFVASHGRMFSFQRVMRRRVLFHPKLRGLPSLDGVALRALSLAGPRLELPLVRIRRMAIDALRKGHRLLEIPFGVAVLATDFQMHAHQRIFGFGMVELHRRIYFFPALRGVAGFARSLERPLVRIRVAVDAGVEFHPRVLHRFVRPGREVAFLASHLGVHPGQRILGFGMVELLGLLPVGYVVAALAIPAQLPLVHVFMAAHAVLGKSQKRLRKIFLLNQRAQRRNHVLRRMALRARHGLMFFHQRISSLPMIELLQRRFPMNQRKIRPIVLQMAPHAVPPIGILHSQKRVIALMHAQPLRNFLMAFQTLERRRAGPKLVARIALRRPIQRLVRLRQRPRRYLRPHPTSPQQHSHNHQHRAKKHARTNPMEAHTPPCCA